MCWRGREGIRELVTAELNDVLALRDYGGVKGVGMKAVGMKGVGMKAVGMKAVGMKGILTSTGPSWCNVQNRMEF